MISFLAGESWIVMAKVTAALAAAFMTTHLMRRRSAASARHLVWAITLGAVCGVALLAPWAPRIVVPLPIAASIPAPTIDATVAPSVLSLEPPPLLRSEPGPAVAPRLTTMQWITRDRRSLLVAVWLIGVLALLGRCVVGHLAVRRLVRRGRHDWSDATSAIVDRIAATLGVRRHVTLVAARVATPVTSGLIHPVIIVPLESYGWSAERWRVVLTHELAHVARHDYLSQLVAAVAQAFFWFHPLVWLAAVRLRTEAEHAADDHVICAGHAPIHYATQLLDLARAERHRQLDVVAVGMLRHSHLEGRLRAMLDSTRPRTTITPRCQAYIAATAMLVLVPFAGLHTRIAAQQPAPAGIAQSITSAQPAPPRAGRVTTPAVHAAPTSSSAPRVSTFTETIVTGYVRDSNGNGIEGVQMSARTTSQGTITSRTNPQGRYILVVHDSVTTLDVTAHLDGVDDATQRAVQLDTRGRLLASWIIDHNALVAAPPTDVEMNTSSTIVRRPATGTIVPPPTRLLGDTSIVGNQMAVLRSTTRENGEVVQVWTIFNLASPSESSGAHPQVLDSQMVLQVHLVNGYNTELKVLWSRPKPIAARQVADSTSYTDSAASVGARAAPTPRGEITIIIGKVVDVHGNGIDGVSITAEGGNSQHVTTTNARGEYRIFFNDAGSKFRVTGHRDGFADASYDAIRSDGDDRLVRNFMLRAADPATQIRRVTYSYDVDRDSIVRMQARGDTAALRSYYQRRGMVVPPQVMEGAMDSVATLVPTVTGAVHDRAGRALSRILVTGSDGVHADSTWTDDQGVYHLPVTSRSGRYRLTVHATRGDSVIVSGTPTLIPTGQNGNRLTFDLIFPAGH